MATKIEWVRDPDGTKGESWNPVTGCSPISEGCRNCWAERMARRLAGRYGYPEAPNHFNVTLHSNRLDVPLKCHKPTTYFVCSMSDLFHKNVPYDFMVRVFQVMYDTPHHTYLLLTKRPERMKRIIGGFTHFENIWLGVTVENQKTADERREYLRQCPAIVKFVSYEPALGPVDWTGTGWEFVNQIISGGESGPKARPSHPDWHRATRDFCQEHSIAYFFKQHGEWLHDSQVTVENVERFVLSGVKQYRWSDGHLSVRIGKKAAGRLLDGRAWAEMPSVCKVVQRLSAGRRAELGEGAE